VGDDGVDLRIWGKEKGLRRPYPLAWHLADTAAVAQRLWERYLSAGVRQKIAMSLGIDEEHAGRLVTFWAGLHDIGKAIPGFQALCLPQYRLLRTDDRFPAPAPPQDMRHEEATHRVLAQMLSEGGYAGGGSAAPAYRVAQLLGGHHGVFRKEDRRTLAHPVLSFPGLGTDGWHEQRVALFQAVSDVLGHPAAPSRVDGAIAGLATGIVILADWLASQETFLQERIEAAGDMGHGLAAQFHSTYEKAPELLEAAGLQPAKMRKTGFTESFDFVPNPLQQSIIDELRGHVTGPGLLLIAAATGDGKTEAGLSAARLLGDASGMPGLFFALPTMATADEMYKRVVRYVRRLAEAPTPVTLLHSMAWLRDAFDAQPVGDGVVSSDEETMVTAPQWLSGAKRGLLAPVAVGTIDQALMGVLQLKHNVLRLLGLSGKVLVVDECHAYDPYMQGLLRRLLTWLGELRCPVVLMSATVPSSIAQSLVGAYVAGTGRRTDPSRFALDYPGWLYVSADAGEPVQVSDAARAKIATHRTATLAVDLQRVRHRTDKDPQDERLTILRSLLTPLATEGGCVAVVCNTVADAQSTYSALRAWADRLDGDVPTLDLLHSRFPARERARRTEGIVGRYGKDGKRPPGGGIVVATQVIEQSLDLDFDLVVSDLAPFAQLLQRAGRGHRHERAGRPGWVKDPRLVVLVPVDAQGGLRRPPHWGTVYPEFLLATTHKMLNERKTAVIEIPGDVNELMELVYNPPSAKPGESFTDDGALTEHWIDYEGDTLAQQSLAELVAVPPPAQIRELSLLSRDGLTEAYATTRMGADSVRALAVYRSDDGVSFLDPHHRRQLPAEGSGYKRRFTKKDIANLLAETIPVPESWVRDRATDHTPPIQWGDNPWLRDLVLLPHGSNGEGTQIGGRILRLDPELGLVREHQEAR
jgi:CRISPR-associated endonuclease/helicase Cas3